MGHPFLSRDNRPPCIYSSGEVRSDTDGKVPRESLLRCDARTVPSPLMTAATGRLVDGLGDKVILRAPNSGRQRIVIDWTFGESKTHSGTNSASVPTTVN